VYAQREPARLIRLRGQPPISGTIYELGRVRCNLCGEVYTADPPPGVGPEKYDPTTGAMIALLKYGSGMPFHRLERLQADLQIPLPASTQWEIVEDLATRMRPVLAELMRHAANGEVVHNDDTSMTVLSRISVPLFRCVTRCRAISRSRWRSSSGIAWRTRADTSWRSRRAFRPSLVASSRR